MNKTLIKFNDVKGLVQEERHLIQPAIERVLESGRFVLGREGEAFEEEWAEYCGARYCVGVGSGTDALKIALLSVKDRAGDGRVLTVANSAPATVTAILEAGFEPAFCDVNENGMMDLESIKGLRLRDISVILPVMLYGRQLDMKAIGEFSDRTGAWVVLDACQGHGWRALTESADVVCFSFYPTKNLGALGDGGAIITDDPATEHTARILRNYGENEDAFWNITHQGYNSRLDELQAAILRERLKTLDTNNEKRYEILKKYWERLNGTFLSPRAGGSFHLAATKVSEAKHREPLQQHLLKRGIETKVHYPIPAYDYGIKTGLELCPCKNTDDWCSKVLSLPLHPLMGEGEVMYVCGAIKEFYDGTDR